jgi:hypothetical protein
MTQAWLDYEAMLCAEGYTGVVCSVCAEDHGQTDIFSCDKCVGGSNKLAAIIWVWVAYFVAFLVYLMVTVVGHLKQNPPPCYRQAEDTSVDTSAISDAVCSIPQSPETSQHFHLPDTTEVAKALVMYMQYVGGIIAKLPVSWPEPLSSISHTFSQVFGWVTGSAASIDCLLSLFEVERAARAGFKGLINLLAPVATFLAMVGLLFVWWVVRRPVYALAAKSIRRDAQGRWRWRAAVMWWCIGSYGVADSRGVSSRFFWLQSKAGRHVPLVVYLCQRIVPVALITAFFWYPSIARIVLGMRACMKVCGTKYWVMDMSLLCPLDTLGEPQAVWSTALTIPSAVVTAGLPLLVLIVLSRWKSRMQEPQFLCWFGFLYNDYNYSSSGGTLQDEKGSRVSDPDSAQAGQQSTDQEDDAACTTGCARLASMIPVVTDWLVTTVRPRVVAAWDVVIHITTLLLTVCSVYGVYGMHEYYQVLLLSTIFVAYMWAVMWVRPFKGFMQHVQVYVAGVLLGTCLCILAIIHPEGLDTRQKDVMDLVSVGMGYIIIICNALCVGVLVLLLLLSVFGRTKQQSSNGSSSRQIVV